MSFLTSLLLAAASFYSTTPIVQPTMVVTAERRTQAMNEALASVSVITRAEIDASQAADVLDLLRLEAGVEFSRTGGAGHQTSLFLRGTNSNHVLVLIDGLRVNNSLTGAFAWEHLSLAQIQRIEIVRGPAAVFYGSEAIGGVIQIFTRRPSGFAAHVEAGSYDTQRASAAYGGGEKQSYDITVSHRRTDGFSAQNANGFSFNPDDDGYRNTSVSAGLSTTLAGAGVSVNAYHADGEVEFDQGVSDTINQTASTAFDWGGHKLQLGFTHAEIETPAFDTGFDSKRFSADFNTQWRLSEAHLTAGLNYAHEQGASYALSTNVERLDGERDNFGVFAALRYPFGDFDGGVALRYDHNSAFGDHLTGKASLAWQLTDRTRAWASYGTAFRAPNFNELFSPGFNGLFAGNPALEPETSESYEVAFEHRIGTDQNIGANIYVTRIDNLIAFEGENFQAVNINSARVEGLELTYSWQPARWSVDAALTLQEAQNQSTGSDLLRRADEKFALSLARLFGQGGNVGLEVIYHGERRDIFNTTLDAYTLVNVRARWPLSAAWFLTGRVENVFDENYALVNGFNTPGLSAYLGLSWRP